MNKVEEATEWTEHRLEPLSGHPYDKLRAGDYRAIIRGTARPIFSGPPDIPLSSAMNSSNSSIESGSLDDEPRDTDENPG